MPFVFIQVMYTQPPSGKCCSVDKATRGFNRRREKGYGLTTNKFVILYYQYNSKKNTFQSKLRKNCKLYKFHMKIYATELWLRSLTSVLYKTGGGTDF